MSFPKIALKGSPTTIKQLESLGGYNSAGCKGFNPYYYYFIDYYGNIDTEMYLPIGYKLVTLEQKQKLFKLI